MYVIIAKKQSEMESRGFNRENNIIVVTADDETALIDKLNELVNEGDSGDHYEIMQVLWKSLL